MRPPSLARKYHMEQIKKGEIKNVSKSKEAPKWKLSDSILLAIVPIASYLIVFVFEAGYFNYYGMPLQFISFSINELLIAAVSLSLLLGLWAFVERIILSIFPYSLPDPVMNRVQSIASIGSLIAILYVYYPEQSNIWNYLFVSLIFVALGEFVLPIFTMKKIKGGYIKKLTAVDKRANKREDVNRNRSLLETVVGRFNKHVLRYLPFAVVLLIGIYFLGGLQGQNQKNYYVVSTNPELVVLYVSTERFIAAPFDRDTKTFEPRFVFISPTQDATIQLIPEHIGPLKLNNESK